MKPWQLVWLESSCFTSSMGSFLYVSSMGKCLDLLELLRKRLQRNFRMRKVLPSTLKHPALPTNNFYHPIISRDSEPPKMSAIPQIWSQIVKFRKSFELCGRNYDAKVHKRFSMPLVQKENRSTHICETSKEVLMKKNVLSRPGGLQRRCGV